MSWTEKDDNRSEYIDAYDDNNKTDNVESDIGPVGNMSSTLTEDAGIKYNEEDSNVEEKKNNTLSQQMDTLNIAQKPSSPTIEEEEEEEDSLIIIPFDFQKESCDVWFKTRTGTVGFPSNYVKRIVKELQRVAIRAIGDGIGDKKTEIHILEISTESLIHVISFYHPKDLVPWKGKVIMLQFFSCLHSKHGLSN